VVLLVVRPSSSLLKESLRLLPDVILLLKRLATDSSQPRRVRVRLALLMAYLAFPLDLIPDFIPVLGYSDDAIIVLVVLRSTARQVGIESLRAQWPGSEDGFTALCRAAGLATR
jgi:uncharacterized membrane protein YkvA (DUF1232 family)